MDNNKGPQLEVPAKQVEKAKAFTLEHGEVPTDEAPSTGMNLMKPLGIVFCPANQGKGIARAQCHPDKCAFSHRQNAFLKLPMKTEAAKEALAQYPWPNEITVIRKESGELDHYEALQLYCMRPKPVNETIAWLDEKENI